MKVILKSGVEFKIDSEEAEALMDVLMGVRNPKVRYVTFKSNGVRYKLIKLIEVSAVI